MASIKSDQTACGLLGCTAIPTAGSTPGTSPEKSTAQTGSRKTSKTRAGVAEGKPVARDRVAGLWRVVDADYSVTPSPANDGLAEAVISRTPEP